MAFLSPLRGWIGAGSGFPPLKRWARVGRPSGTGGADVVSRDGASGARDVGRLCRTNPISGTRLAGRGATGPRPPSQEPNVQNEPNLPGGARWDGVWGTRIMEAKRAKRTQFPVVPGRMGTQRSGTRHKCAKRIQFPGRSPVGRGHRGVGRGANMRNEPNLAGRSGRPSLASPPSGLAPAKSIMQNKPNFRWSAKTPRPDCAKQSQFPPGPGGTRSGGRGQTCETNPICPAGLGGPPSPLPPGLAPAKSIMKNKPNSWRSARPQERIVQNEANLPGGAGRARAAGARDVGANV